MISVINAQLCELPATRTPIQPVVCSLGRLASVLPDLESQLRPGLAALAPVAQEQKLCRLLDHFNRRKRLMVSFGWQEFSLCARKLMRLIRRTGAWARMRSRLMTMDVPPMAAGISANSCKQFAPSPEAQLLRLARQLAGSTGGSVDTVLLQFSVADADADSDGGGAGGGFHCHCVTVGGCGRQAMVAAAFVTHEMRTVASAAEADAANREAARRFREPGAGGGGEIAPESGRQTQEREQPKPSDEGEERTAPQQTRQLLHGRERFLETWTDAAIPLAHHNRRERKSQLLSQLRQHNMKGKMQRLNQPGQENYHTGQALALVQHPQVQSEPEQQLQHKNMQSSQIQLQHEDQQNEDQIYQEFHQEDLHHQQLPHVNLRHQQLQNEDLQYQECHQEDLQPQLLQNEDQHHQQLQQNDLQDQQLQMLDHLAEQLSARFSNEPTGLNEEKLNRSGEMYCPQQTLVWRQTDSDTVSGLSNQRQETKLELQKSPLQLQKEPLLSPQSSPLSTQTESESHALQSQIQKLQKADKLPSVRCVQDYQVPEGRIRRRWALESSTSFSHAEQMAIPRLADYPDQDSNATSTFKNGNMSDCRTHCIIAEEVKAEQHQLLGINTALLQVCRDQPDLASTRTQTTSCETIGRSTDVIKSDDSSEAWNPIMIFRDGRYMYTLLIPDAVPYKSPKEGEFGKCPGDLHSGFRTQQSPPKVRKQSDETHRPRGTRTDDATPSNAEGRFTSGNDKLIGLNVTSTVAGKHNVHQDGVLTRLEDRLIANDPRSNIQRCEEKVITSEGTRREHFELLERIQKKTAKDGVSKLEESDAIKSKPRQAAKLEKLRTAASLGSESGERSKSDCNKDWNKLDAVKEKLRTLSTTKSKQPVAEVASRAKIEESGEKWSKHLASNPKEPTRRRLSEMSSANVAAATHSFDVSHIISQQTKLQRVQVADAKTVISSRQDESRTEDKMTR